MGFLKDRLAGFAPESRLLSGLYKRKQGGALFGYYQVVSDEPVPHTDAIIPRITIDRFKKDLDTLLMHFRPLAFDDFLKGSRPNVPSIMITFDDGYREMRDYAAPILLEKGVPAAFFINSSLAENTRFLHRHKVSILIHQLRSSKVDGRLLKEFSNSFNVQIAERQQAIDLLLGLSGDSPAIEAFAKALGIDFQEYLNIRKPFLTLEDMKEMAGQGFYFGGHSVSHPDYAKIGQDEQIGETIGSIDFVQNGLELPYRIFAFPYSDRPVSSLIICRMLEMADGARPDLLFGNSGLKKDVHARMIQRVSFERPGFAPLKATNIELLHGLISGQQIPRS